ncbi:MAG TPA: SDR family NAD(P)-dependent oxidoreductase [Candidatus Limnocylindrales bacterium]|nr:SDR family NAD(P)-dependent oxidoreductase [Candidatus Limnocylindrales bacterium]
MAPIVITGAAGFIGSRIARRLYERGDEVVAIVRDPARADALRDLGVRLVAGDLSDQADIRRVVAGAGAVIHGAGVYHIGIPVSERPAMYDANVAATERVLDAAIAEGVGRIVHLSTVNAFGDTRGIPRDETFQRDPADGFVSYYDETKYLAHRAAEKRIAAGAPIVVVMPGTVYGPGDHSAAGAQLKAAFDGTARYLAMTHLGISPAHVDDIASGIVAALDHGRIGQAYVLCGTNMRLGEAMAIAAAAGGRRLPRLTVPVGLLRLTARILPGGGRLLGVRPNLGELIRASDGVTYWANHGKATAELGYSPRDLETGARDAFGPG